jgi:integrase
MPLKLTRRHGSAFWYIRGTVRGVTVDESTGLIERKDAEALRTRREWEITQGTVFGRRATARFIEAAVIYMETGGERRFLAPIIHEIGAKPLAQIDQLTIERLAAKLYPDARPSTRNRQVYTPISAVLKHAHARKLCDNLKVERLKEPGERVRWLTHDEADKLLEACAGHIRPLVTFLLGTGARLSEALYLDWAQVNLAAAHVSFLDTKNGEARGVPLHSRVVAALANLEHRLGRVFLRPDGLPYAFKSDGGGQIKTAFNGACRRAGIADFSPHDCRHTWATWHYRANRDLLALKKLGGWKSERMVMRYAHVNTGELAHTIKAITWGESGDTKNLNENIDVKSGA